RRVQQEGALDADPRVRNLADGEGLADAGQVVRDHDALEHLNALLVAFDDLRMDAHGVAGAELRQFGALLHRHPIGLREGAFLLSGVLFTPPILVAGPDLSGTRDFGALDLTYGFRSQCHRCTLLSPFLHPSPRRSAPAVAGRRASSATGSSHQEERPAP